MASFGVHTTKLRCDHPQVCFGPASTMSIAVVAGVCSLLPLWYGAGPTADDTPEPRMQQVSSKIEALQ